MREKYIEERFPRYFEFGTRSNGCVDLATCNNDTVATVSKEHANNLIKERNEVIDMLCLLAQKLEEIAPEDFKKVWYS